MPDNLATTEADRMVRDVQRRRRESDKLESDWIFAKAANEDHLAGHPERLQTVVEGVGSCLPPGDARDVLIGAIGTVLDTYHGQAIRLSEIIDGVYPKLIASQRETADATDKYASLLREFQSYQNAMKGSEDQK